MTSKTLFQRACRDMKWHKWHKCASPRPGGMGLHFLAPLRGLGVLMPKFFGIGPKKDLAIFGAPVEGKYFLYFRSKWPKYISFDIFWVRISSWDDISHMWTPNAAKMHFQHFLGWCHDISSQVNFSVGIVCQAAVYKWKKFSYRLAKTILLVPNVIGKR